MSNYTELKVNNQLDGSIPDYLEMQKMFKAYLDNDQNIGTCDLLEMFKDQLNLKEDIQSAIMADLNSDDLPWDQKTFLIHVVPGWAGNLHYLIFPFLENVIGPVLDEYLFTGRDNNPHISSAVLMAVLLIKDLEKCTDVQVLEKIATSKKGEWALHGNSVKARSTISLFRQRGRIFQDQTGIDPLKKTLDCLHAFFASATSLHVNAWRMDSFMIDLYTNPQTTRLQLFYSIAHSAVKRCKRQNIEVIDSLQHYLADDDKNKVTYHYINDQNKEDKLLEIAHDIEQIKDLYADQLKGTLPGQAVDRLLQDHTFQDENGNLQLKDSADISSRSIQHCRDLEATFRVKNGQRHKGYVLHIYEALEYGTDDSIIKRCILGSSFKPNVYSDKDFSFDTINELPKQEESRELFADGAYCNLATVKQAKEKNLLLSSASLTGRKTPEIFADFNLTEDQKALETCANGQKPSKCSYQPSNQVIYARFEGSVCENCPLLEKCRVKKQKKGSYAISIPSYGPERAKLQRINQSSSQEMRTRRRNGIESIGSQLRNKKVDQIPVYGKNQIELFVGFKLLSISARRAWEYLIGDMLKELKKQVVNSQNL